MAVTAADRGIAAAYSATGQRWQDGPGRIYDRLAELLVAASPVPLAGATVLDVGAGTGAATRAALAAGAGHVVALDPAFGMLAADAARRPPAVVADARRLPLRAAGADVAVAAFSFNHLPDPAPAMTEVRGALRPGGALVAGTYATDDSHPAKAAVADALRQAGWEPPDWYRWVQEHTVAGTANAEQMATLATDAGFVEVDAVYRAVPFPELGPLDLVEWRLGMAQHAPFFASLSPDAQQVVVATAAELLGDDPEPLVRSVVVLRARTPADGRPVS